MLEKLLNFAAEKENVEDGSELSVTFVSNERIQEINREYRDKDQQQMLSHLPWKNLEKEKFL